MTSTVCVLLSCLFLASQGSADMDNNQQIEMVMSKMKAAIMFEVEERVEEMRGEMKDMKKQLERLESRNVELTTKLKEVDHRSLRDLPYVLTCAYQDQWTTKTSAPITYDRLTVDYNNSDRPGGGDGEMDINTGKFTALTAGHYTITYSG